MSVSSPTLTAQPDPITRSIHPQTGLGPVTLNVRNLSAMTAYYTQLGLAVLKSSHGEAILGVDKWPLLMLRERPGLAQRKEAGLFHFALLLPTRGDLGLVLHHLMGNELGFGGASDHAVSEALYLDDPEGNGIEIYRDRPREAWTYPGGVLRIVTERLDFAGVMAAAPEGESWQGFPQGTVMGHVHLRVTDLAATRSFYEGILGFDHVTTYGGQASFAGAGGYHHHLGMNVWGGPFPPRHGESLGLAGFAVELPNEAALAEVRDRLAQADWPHTVTADGIHVTDPSGIHLLIRLL